MAPEIENATQQAIVVPMPEPSVSFTVKEILVRLEGKLDHITGTVLKDLSDRVSAIEHEKANRKVFRENWIAIVALLTGLLAGVGTIILALQSVHH